MGITLHSVDMALVLVRTTLLLLLHLQTHFLHNGIDDIICKTTFSLPFLWLSNVVFELSVSPLYIASRLCLSHFQRHTISEAPWEQLTGTWKMNWLDVCGQRLRLQWSHKIQLKTCAENISLSPWGNFLNFGHLDSRTDWLHFGGHRSRSLSPQTMQFWPWM